MIRQLLLAVATMRPAASVISAVASAIRRPGLATRPVAVSVPLPRVTGRMFTSEAMGDGAIRPSARAVMNSRPDSPLAPAATVAGSY